MEVIQAMLSAVVVPEYKPSSKVLCTLTYHVSVALNGFLF